MAAVLSKLTVDPTFSALKKWLIKKTFSRVFILCDNNTRKHCLPVLTKHVAALKKAIVISVSPGEKNKTLQSAEQVWQELFRHQADRKSLLINLGGGMITDLGGFCASVFKRGIATIHIPTSVMSMADAAIGGKTGIDTGHLKNAIGTFYQPLAIFTAPRFLTTLPSREYNSGFSEVCKMGIVADRRLWKQIKSRSNRSNDMSMIEKAAAAKRAICRRDPLDHDGRKILNFGHTAGHAIESWFLAQNKPIPHGEAVAAGMIIESHIAVNKKLLSLRAFAEIAEVLTKQSYLPDLRVVKIKALSKYIFNDKKNDGGKVFLALPKDGGRGKVDVPCTLDEIGHGLANYQTLTS